MAMLGRMRSPDGVYRVEIWEPASGRQPVRVFMRGYSVAELPDLEHLATWLRDRAGLALGDLIED